MDKVDTKDWVGALEEMVDNKLKKWRKGPRIENGENIRLRWEFEQTDIHIDVFWENGVETVRLKFMSPRNDQDFMCHGLSEKTFNKIQDRVGNLAMAAMHPVKDPEFP